MNPKLCLTIRFIQPSPVFHGNADAGIPEWPPSPLRAFAALLNAAATIQRGQIDDAVRAVFGSMEATPEIVAPVAETASVGYRAYVPHNQGDLVTAAWSRGNLDESIAKHRMEKDIRGVRIHSRDDEVPAIHYLYRIGKAVDRADSFIQSVRRMARSITHLGWGIDMAVGDAILITDEEAANLQGIRWTPSPVGGTPLRTPKPGTLDDLCRKHTAFLNRLSGNGFRPVPPLRVFDIVRYRRQDEPLTRPFEVFELHDDTCDTLFRYPQAKLIHIAGMVRHLAIDAMKRSPPPGLPSGEVAAWIDTYVAGHRRGAVSAPPSADGGNQAGDSECVERRKTDEHRQLSYLPLPSIGHHHVDPSVRRVMITAPAGDDHLLRHLAQRLDGLTLKPTPQTGLKDPPRLKWIRPNSFAKKHYIGRSRHWASVTPVILPGHDDHKPEKTHKLILKALAQSGVEQPCRFEWSAFSRFPHSLSAHKYDRDKRRVGYWRPDHLEGLSAVHVRLEFATTVPGPLSIGAGRHCGLGLFAAV